MSQYSVKAYNNGGTTVTNSISLTGTLAAGDVYVIYNSSAIQAIKDVGDVTSTVTYFNGDDTVTLEKGDQIIDVIGQLGYDPGSSWTVGGVSTAEMTLVRKPGTLTGYTGTGVYDPSVYWFAYPQDTSAYLGSHSNVYLLA